MKTRRLPEIDLARLSTIPTGPRLEKALQSFNSGGGSWSYEPVRHSTSDILGVPTELYGPLEQMPWSKIKLQIEASSTRGPEQLAANVEVGKVLYDAQHEMNWSSIGFDMGSMPTGVGGSVRYWCDVIINDGGTLLIPFFDHRRGNGIISRKAKQFIFSMQHAWIRERHLELANARLAILRFPQNTEHRSIHIDLHNDEELLSYDKLNSIVQSIYETWALVSAKHHEEVRKTGTGPSNPFGF